MARRCWLSGEQWRVLTSWGKQQTGSSLAELSKWGGYNDVTHQVHEPQHFPEGNWRNASEESQKYIIANLNWGSGFPHDFVMNKERRVAWQRIAPTATKMFSTEKHVFTTTCNRFNIDRFDLRRLKSTKILNPVNNCGGVRNQQTAKYLTLKLYTAYPAGGLSKTVRDEFWEDWWDWL